MSRTIGAEKSVVPILRIPFDALFEIIKDLEWSDILRFRQTCRHLGTATDDRSVWVHLYNRYRATLEPRMHWPDRPLDLYNAKELQELVLRPFKVDRAWKTDNIAASSRLSFPVGRTIYSGELIRGGRWLLVGTDKGEILYFDLDAPVVKPRVLIPSAYGEAEVHIYPLISIDMDDSEPNLTFNIAVVSHGYGAETLAPFYGKRPIQVWRVKGVPDADGHIVDLQGEKLASFADEPRCLAGSLSLRGNLLAYFRQDLYISLVIDWTDAKESSPTNMKVIVPPEGLEYMSLLPNDWIMCASTSSAYLYALEDLAPEPDFTSPSPTKAEFLVTAQGSFSTFVVGNSTRFVYRGSGGKTIGGITVPHSDPTKTTIKTLHSNFPCEWNDKIIAGHNDAVVFHPDGRFSVASYSWDGEEGIPVDSSPKAFQVQEKGWCVVDRSSGRIVVLHRQGQDYGCVALGL